MFKPRHFLSDNFVSPFFVELVLDADMVTVRTYEEVSPIEPLPGQELDRFVGVHQSSVHTLSRASSGSSPVNTHLPLQGGERWPVYVPKGDAKVLVRGEELSPSLIGKLFLEIGASCLDRRLDPGLTEDQWTDSGEWLFGVDANSGRPYAPYNKNIFTQSARVRGSRFSMMFGHSPVFRLFQPFKETPLDECSMYLSTHHALGFRTSKLIDWIDARGPHADLTQLLPALRWSSAMSTEVGAEGSTELIIECIDPRTGAAIPVSEGDISIEADSGYLPVRRCPLVEGIASVKLKALDLPKGHRIRVSAGFNGAPSRLRTELTVV